MPPWNHTVDNTPVGNCSVVNGCQSSEETKWRRPSFPTKISTSSLDATTSLNSSPSAGVIESCNFSITDKSRQTRTIFRTATNAIAPNRRIETTAKASNRALFEQSSARTLHKNTIETPNGNASRHKITPPPSDAKNRSLIFLPLVFMTCSMLFTDKAN